VGKLIVEVSAGSIQSAVVMLAHVEDSGDCALSAVWVVNPAGDDGLEFIGLPPATWVGETRIEALYCLGNLDAFERAVAGLLEDHGVKQVAGTVVLEPGDVVSMLEPGVFVGHVLQNPEAVRAYVAGAADALDTIERQRRVLQAALHAGIFSDRIAQYAQFDLPEDDRRVFLERLAGGQNIWFTRLDFETCKPDGQPAYCLAPAR
jgi:hypothetical protein